MSKAAIRWIQRFDNFKRAFRRLSDGAAQAMHLTHPELIDHIRRVGVVFHERTPAEMKP